jgi:hypothetical protein
MQSLSVLSFLVGSLLVLCDEIVLLDDVIARRLFKALLPRIKVLLVKIAGFPALKIESPVMRREEKCLDNQCSLMHVHASFWFWFFCRANTTQENCE